MDTLTLFLLFLLIPAAIGISWFAGSDAPFVPTKMELITKVLKGSGVKKGKIFYELGSGDGRVVLEAAKLGADATGIEQSWLRVWYSRYQARKLHLKNAQFCHGDIFTRHYYPADIVYIYLLKKAVSKLEQKLKNELKPNSIVITQTYHFPHLKPFVKIGNFNLYKIQRKGYYLV